VLERKAFASVKDEQRNTDVKLSFALFKSSDFVVADTVTIILLNTLLYTYNILYT